MLKAGGITNSSCPFSLYEREDNKRDKSIPSMKQLPQLETIVNREINSNQ